MRLRVGQTWELRTERGNVLTVLVLGRKPNSTLPVMQCLILTSTLENCEAGETDLFANDWFEEETSSLLS